MIEKIDKSKIAPLLFLLLTASLLFPNLGQRPYWTDELEDFNYIYKIVEQGYPNMEGTSFQDTFLTNSDNIYIRNTWGYLYLQAMIVKKFDWDNEFAFRLPTTILALLSVLGVWKLAKFWELKGYWTTLLYALSPFFLVPARLSRYYGPIFFFTPFIILAYFETREGKPWSGFKLGILCALMFHFNFMITISLAIGLILHWLFTGTPQQKQALYSVLIAAIPVFGWIYFIKLWENPQADFTVIPKQSIKAIWLLLASYIPFILIFWLWTKKKKLKKFLQFSLFFFTPLILISSSSTASGPNLRYLLPILCMSCCALGYLLETYRFKTSLYLGSLYLFTNFFQLFPLFFFTLLPQDSFLASDKKNSGSINRFVENTAKPRFLLGSYLVEISSDYQSPSQDITSLLKKEGYLPGEKVSYIGHLNESKIYSSAQNVYFLGNAMFYLNRGEPPEVLKNLITYEVGAKWVFCSEGCSPQRIFSDYQLVGSFKNELGFFIDGENPFNRRYKTKRTHSFKLYKKKINSE
jgi:hypothetical protein